LIEKIASELRRYSIELGREGTLLRIRLKEILSGVEKETDVIVRDYAKLDLDQTIMVLNALNYEEILDENVICQVLGYENPNVNGVIPGWHIMIRTSLSDGEIDSVIRKSENNWEKIATADEQFFTDVIGEEKSRILREDIRKMKMSFNV
jgi:diadenylate cyclase